MHVADFFNEMGLAGHQIPSSVRWVLDGEKGIAATARLDKDEGNLIEFGVYETVDGGSSAMTGIAQLTVEEDQVVFRDEPDELFFERFAETVRLMRRVPPE